MNFLKHDLELRISDYAWSIHYLYNGHDIKVTSVGEQKWMLYGKSHRIDGPSMVVGGLYEAWSLFGNLHRIGGPAITWFDGDRSWYSHGVLHNENGPAKIFSDGAVLYCVDGDIIYNTWE